MSDRPDRGRPMPEIIAGHYRTVTELGAGGMGRIYKAIDTRLNRAVAIKAIHDDRLRHTDAGERLRTEALAAASLDHPYICKVYELIDDGHETFIVMEFVEGETLAAMLRRGTPSLAQTIQLGREIAEGLAAAHARGLVHRDVKPSNVMVTTHGHVKLLDFGLARIDVATTPDEATRTSPAHVTSYAGTPHYMSPEQAAGKPITARADLFSFGVVLYECLTGRLPFSGTSAYDYVRHLLSEAPHPLHKLVPNAPADLVKLIERCLDKTPASRPESAGVIVAELQRLSEALTGSGEMVRTAAAERRRRQRQVLLGAGAVGVIAIGAWQWLRPAPPEIIRRSRPLITWPTEESGSRLSPDGQWIAFLSARGGLNQIFVQRLEGGEARPVALPTGRPASFVWSPDSNRLAVLLEEEGASLLHIVPAFFGGPVLRTVTVGRALNPKLLRWIDRTVYAQIDSGKGSTRQLHAFTLEPEARRIVTESWSDAASLQAFDVSPDGTRVAFVVQASGQPDLFTANLDGTSRSRLTNDSSFERAPMWLGNGAGVIFTSNRGGQIDLWEVIAATGEVRPLTQSDSEEFVESSSPDGAIVSYQQQSADAKLWLWDLAASKARQITSGSLREYSPLFSQPGGLMAFQQSQPNPSIGSAAMDSRLLVAPFDPGKSQLEPRPVADGYAASLSPDGAWIAYLQGTTGPGQGQLKLTQLRTGETRTLSSSAKIQSWSPRPLDWSRPAIVWGGDALFFIDLSSPMTVRRAQTTSTDPPLAVVSAKPNEMIEEVHAGPDPASLTFMSRSGQTSTLYVVNLSTAAVRELGRLPASSVLGRGWLPDRSAFVLTTAVKFNLDRSTDIDVYLVAPDGRARTIGRIERAFPATTRLDGERGALFVTRSDDGIHNLYEFSLKSGAQRKITDNTIAEVTFSGATPVGGGKLIVVRDERKRDIWLMEARSAK